MKPDATQSIGPAWIELVSELQQQLWQGDSSAR